MTPEQRAYFEYGVALGEMRHNRETYSGGLYGNMEYTSDEAKKEYSHAN